MLAPLPVQSCLADSTGSVSKIAKWIIHYTMHTTYSVWSILVLSDLATFETLAVRCVLQSHLQQLVLNCR